MDRWYVTSNDKERQRLREIVSGLTTEDLNRRLGNGLSVAEALVHLAFWDEYCRHLLVRCEESGIVAMGPDYDSVNAGVQAVAVTVPDGAAIALVLNAADAVDEQVAELSPEFAEAVHDELSPRVLERAAHRREHLDQIEGLLGEQ